MRFFRGECTIAEAKQVAEYLESHKEIMDAFFDEEDWLATVHDRPYLRVPYTEAELLSAIQQQLSTGKKRGSVKQIRPWLKWAAAACFVLLTTGLLVYLLRGEKNHPASVIAAIPDSIPVNDSMVWQNNSAESENRYLSDGSLVCLEPGSSLRYRQNFGADGRWLSLEGIARFEVAKDTRRPFTVVAGNISTTAIGTIFTVSSLPETNRVRVRLLEGKVLVKNIKQPANALYLMPGEYCSFNGRVLYREDALWQMAGSGKKTGTETDSTYYIFDGSQVVFNNTALPSVFEALGELYNVKILYKKIPDSILAQTLYSGSFDKTRIKIEKVLRTVSIVNDLRWEQIDSAAYLISPR